MNSNIKYSAFRYMPSFITAESLIIGMLISVDGEYSFYPTTNFNRVKEFDDELNIDYLKNLLKTLEKELSTNIINTEESILSKKSHFVNEFSFDPIVDMGLVEDVDDVVDSLKKTYLKYDYEKSKRLSKKDELKLINVILKSNHIEYAQRQYTTGHFEERIWYDYIFLDYGIKFFSFNSKSLNQVLNHIKAWAWNCSKNNNIKTVFIYDYDKNEYPENQKDVEILLNILKNETELVYDIQRGLDFVSTIAKK